MHVVLINGPAGAGKNTLAEALRVKLHAAFASNRLSPLAQTSSIGVEEFKQPLINMLFAFAESLSIIELGVVYRRTSKELNDLYAELKVTKMLGRTGREWQICWADAMRNHDQLVFVHGLFIKIENMALDIALIPDCGFADEYTSTLGRFDPENVTLIYLDGWQDHAKIYNSGTRFDNDIRVSLRDQADLVNPSQTIAVEYIVGKMRKNAAEL